MTVGDILRYFADRNPDKAAVYDLDRKITFKDLNGRVNRLANKFLSLGFRENDKMAILLYNRSEYVEIIFALAKIGVTSIPIHFRLVGEEIQYILSDSDSRGFILEEEF